MNLRYRLFFLLLCLLAVPAHAADVAGKIGYMSGSLVAKRTDGTVQFLAPKSVVMEGDVLQTSPKGYAQVLMNDGTKMTLRPNTSLKVETYHFVASKPKEDNAILRLIKGGFRTLSGLISKRGNPDAYKLHAATATIGIRGTDFTTLLCFSKDCQDEGQSKQPPPPPPKPVIGRVMLLKGGMSAKDTSGKEHKLLLGSPIYEGDTLKTASKSYAVVAFRDGGRITLQQSSVFAVEKFKYDKEHSEESEVVRLLKGTARVISGLIGHVHHDDYQFHVASATIGIRGTGFDAWCNGACASGGNPGATQGNPQDGAGVYVWSGAVVLVTPQGSVNVALQQAAMIARETGKAVPIMKIPKGIIKNKIPRPDSIPVDLQKEFQSNASSGGPGLYVTVHDGKVIVTQDGNKLDLGRGETGFANARGLSRLSRTPGFMGHNDSIDIPGGNNGSAGGGQNSCAIR